ncbi:MAG: suppressor of fused domain protein [Gemmataceae bacterium]
MSTPAETHAANSQTRLVAYRKLFGGKPSAVFTFADADHPIEVLVFDLEREGQPPFVAAVTSGMSDQRMVGEGEDDAEWSRREIIQYLPTCDEAHARRLRDMAWLPLFDGFSLDSHHTIEWPDAALPGSPWKNAFFLEPLLKSHRNFRFKIADDEASFLWHIPISDEEYAYKKENGSNALLDRLEEVVLPWIFDENNRPSLV